MGGGADLGGQLGVDQRLIDDLAGRVIRSPASAVRSASSTSNKAD